MEGLWILLGAALSTGSGVIFWLLNSRTARETQQRQHRHDLGMQERRLQAERAMAEDEAIRLRRRERLEPVFDVLRELEGWFAYNGAEAVFRSLGGAPEGLEVPEAPKMWDLLFRTVAVSHRVGDENLRDEIANLSASLMVSQDDTVQHPSKLMEARETLRHVHARLEAYAARIDEETEEPRP